MLFAISESVNLISEKNTRGIAEAGVRPPVATSVDPVEIRRVPSASWAAPGNVAAQRLFGHQQRCETLRFISSFTIAKVRIHITDCRLHNHNKK
jgi:hypothetical protein